MSRLTLILQRSSSRHMIDVPEMKTKTRYSLQEKRRKRQNAATDKLNKEEKSKKKHTHTQEQNIRLTKKENKDTGYIQLSLKFSQRDSQSVKAATRTVPGRYPAPNRPTFANPRQNHAGTVSGCPLRVSHRRLLRTEKQRQQRQ